MANTKEGALKATLTKYTKAYFDKLPTEKQEHFKKIKTVEDKVIYLKSYADQNNWTMERKPYQKREPKDTTATGKRGRKPATPVMPILDAFKQLFTSIEAEAHEATDNMLMLYYSKLEDAKGLIEGAKEKARQKKIDDLKKQAAEIAAKLAELGE